MWNDIISKNDIINFMEKVYYFHDSCIKEMKYISGSYVNEKLAMHPINDQRILDVVIQRQFEDVSMIELEFIGLKYLNLTPTNPCYTSEILDSTLIIKDNSVYWCDCGGLSESDLEEYDGTLICASRVRWRSVDGHMGKEDFYVSNK